MDILLWLAPLEISVESIGCRKKTKKTLVKEVVRIKSKHNGQGRSANKTIFTYVDMVIIQARFILQASRMAKAILIKK